MDNINQSNQQLIQKCHIFPSTNFVKYLMKSRKGIKLSISCKYDYSGKENRKYISYFDVLNNIAPHLVDDNFYVGLAPDVSTLKLAQELKNHTFDNSNNLKAYMKSIATKFMLPVVTNNKSEKYIEALFARTLVRVAYKYGFKLKVRETDINDLKEIIENKKEYDYYLRYDEIEKMLYIRGRIPDNIIQSFIFNRYVVDGNNLVLERNNSNGIYLGELYNQNNPVPVELVEGKEYYSGVIPRLIKIQKEPQLNPNVDSYSLYIERTTFAYEDSLDNIKTNHFAILADYFDILNEYEQSEDLLEQKYIYDVADDSSLVAINQYLEESINSNVIAITSNIVTKDKQLLLTRRSNESVDKGTLYPSVNGQSEIYDEKVSFYALSAFEDLPTLNIKSPRIDFENEISREMIAELSLPGFSLDKEIRGFSVLGMDQRKLKNNNYKRRLHFNVLALHHSEYSFNHVNNVWSKSIESFENTNIFGLEVNIYHNHFHLAWHQITRFIKVFNSNKNLATGFYSLIVSIIAMTANSFAIDFNSIFSLIATIALIIVGVPNLIKGIIKLVKFKRISCSVSLINNKNSNFNSFYCRCLHRLQNKKLLKINGEKVSYLFSPISLIMLYDYLEGILEGFKKKK